MFEKRLFFIEIIWISPFSPNPLSPKVSFADSIFAEMIFKRKSIRIENNRFCFKQVSLINLNITN